MDHIIGFPYPFSNSALKNWPCTKQCFSAIICTFSSINVSQRRKNWPPHHHRILPKKKLAICWWAHHMPRWSEPRAPTNKQGGGGGGREGRGGEGGWGRRGSVSGRWQGYWPPLDIAPGSQALGALSPPKKSERKGRQKGNWIPPKWIRSSRPQRSRMLKPELITIEVQTYLVNKII